MAGGKSSAGIAGTSCVHAGCPFTRRVGEKPMGPAYYVIAILGCADGSEQCTPLATVPTRYESDAACAAAVVPALEARTDFDFPTLVAECRPVVLPVANSDERPVRVTGSTMRG
jgi:hypothetical protein